MADEVEDNNSWNELIFRQIKARKDWFLALVWRRRLEFEEKTTDEENEDLEVQKKMDLDPESPLFIKWCDERKEMFDELITKKTGFSVEKVTEELASSSRKEHAPEAEKLNGVPHEEAGNSKLPLRKVSPAESMTEEHCTAESMTVRNTERSTP